MRKSAPHEFVAALDDRGVFCPGERDAWEEGIDEADEMTGEALDKALVDREGVEEVVSEHTEERTQAFV
mgnify:CR=1 FL=1